MKIGQDGRIKNGTWSYKADIIVEDCSILWGGMSVPTDKMLVSYTLVTTLDGGFKE